MGKLSRNKGASFERKIANTFKQIFGNARRGCGQTQSASNGADVEGTPFWIECKKGARPNIQGAFRQALEARPKDDIRPVLVVSMKDRDQPLYTVDEKTFILFCQMFSVYHAERRIKEIKNNG